jgi:hypothetical protein
MMNQVMVILMVLLLGWASGGAQRPNRASVVVDRLVAVVNGAPITESDVLWFLALDPEVPDGDHSISLKRQALEQIIDQKLLHQEAEKLPAGEISDAAVTEHIASHRRLFQSEEAFHRRRARVGLSDEALREVVKNRLEILQFIDFRFRAFVIVTEAETQSYYERAILPVARQSGEAPPAIEQVKDVIQKTITQDKVEAEMIAWFEEARRRSDIVYLVEY